MQANGLNHLSLSVRDFARSAAFYDRLMGFLGCSRVDDRPDLILWWGPAGGLTIQPATSAGRHDRTAPGLHHFAFHAPDRAAVDALHRLLLEMRAEILDAPAEYAYAPGYYAVYFLDPDGIKLEYATLDQA